MVLALRRASRAAGGGSRSRGFAGEPVGGCRARHISGTLGPRSAPRTGRRRRDSSVCGPGRSRVRPCRRRRRNPDPRTPRHGVGVRNPARFSLSDRRRPGLGPRRLRHEGGHRRGHGGPGRAGGGGVRKSDAAAGAGRRSRKRGVPRPNRRAGPAASQRLRARTLPRRRRQGRAQGPPASSGCAFGAGPRTPVSSPSEEHRRSPSWRVA